MKVLVNGGSGFIGGNVCDVLLGQGHEVAAIYHTLPEQSAADAAEEVGQRYCADINDAQAFHDIVDAVRPEAVINCAGTSCVKKGEGYATGTQYLLEAVYHHGLPLLGRFVMIGTAAVYGEPETDYVSAPLHETDPTDPKTDYAKAKLSESERAREFGNRYGIQVVEGRMFNPVGPGMPSRQLLPQVLARIGCYLGSKAADHTGLELDMARQLTATRGYFAVQDAAEALALLAVGAQNLEHDVYNIGPADCTTNEELIAMALDAYDLPFTVADVVHVTQPRSLPWYPSRADTMRMVELGWSEPTKRGLRAAVSNCVELATRN